MQTSKIVAATNLARCVANKLRVALFIAVGVLFAAEAAASAIFGVFCRVCAARNADRALNICVDVAKVA